MSIVSSPCHSPESEILVFLISKKDSLFLLFLERFNFLYYKSRKSLKFYIVKILEKIEFQECNTVPETDIQVRFEEGIVLSFFLQSRP